MHCVFPVREQAIHKQQLEGQVNVLNEQILAGAQNEEHYKGRLQTIEEELSVRILRRKNWKKTSLIWMKRMTRRSKA